MTMRDQILERLRNVRRDAASRGGFPQITRDPRLNRLDPTTAFRNPLDVDRLQRRVDPAVALGGTGGAPLPLSGDIPQSVDTRFGASRPPLFGQFGPPGTINSGFVVGGRERADQFPFEPVSAGIGEPPMTFSEQAVAMRESQRRHEGATASGTGGSSIPAGGVGRAEGVGAGPEDDEAQLAIEAARIQAGVSPLGPGSPNVRVFGGASRPLNRGLGRIPLGRRNVFNRLGEDTFR